MKAGTRIVVMCVLLLTPLAVGAEEGEIWIDEYLVFGQPVESYGDEVGVTQEAATRGKTSELADLTVTFERAPLLVLLYQVGASEATSASGQMAGTTWFRRVEPGNYEMLVGWGSDWGPRTFVFRDDIVVEEGENSFSISNSEARHRVAVEPYAKDGSMLRSGYVTFRQCITRKGNPTPLIFKGGGVSFGDIMDLIPWFMDYTVSDMGDQFRLETFIAVEAPGAPRGHELYTMHLVAKDGVNEHQVTVVGPDDWGDAILVHEPGPGVDQIRFRRSATARPFDLDDNFLGRGSINCKGPEAPLERPFEQTIHFQPRPDPECVLGYFRIYAQLFDDCTSEATLYVTPYMTWDDGLLGYHLGTDGTPVLSSQHKRIPIGKGPLFWFARSVNLEDRVVVRSSIGQDLLPFLPQSGSAPYDGIRTVEVRLWEGSLLVYDSVHDFIDVNSLEFDIAPGEYSLELAEVEYVDGVRTEFAKARLTGNSLSEDRDPPHIEQVRLFDSVGPTASLAAGGHVEVLATDTHDIALASALIETANGRTGIYGTKRDEGFYRFSVPRRLPASGPAELVLVFVDAAGNRLETTTSLEMLGVDGPVRHESVD